MNKNQLIMAIIGGTALVAVLGIGYFIYDEIEVHEDADMQLQAQVSVYQQNKDATRDEEKAILKNVAALADWSTQAIGTASALTNAVRYAEPMIPSMLQEQMREDVRRFESQPEDLAVKIVNAANEQSVFPDFKDYLSGRVPSPEEMATLQRQWADVSLITDVLLASGVQSLESVKIEPRPETEDGPMGAQAYTFVFAARPEPLVKTLNALASTEIFLSVDALSFAQEPDPLVTILSGSTKKKDGEGRRRRRRGGDEEAAAEKSEGEGPARSGTVSDPSDPLVCTPFKVTMTISTLAVKAAKEEEK